MRSYSTFIFDSYTWNPNKGTVTLKYSLDDEVHFAETLTLPLDLETEPQLDADFDAALFALHIIGGISYYKTCLPKTMEIRSGSLTLEQASFWNAVYENGLGEFFYKNQIDFRGLINFPSKNTDHTIPSPKPVPDQKRRVLVPLGGGKDSVVTAELLRGKADCTLFRMGANPLIDRLANVIGLPLLTINRALSPELFKLNEQGALNGHVPITAYLSCVTILASLLYKFDEVAMSNEKSANIGNVEFHGKMINHQWSKSAEFESAFRNYVRSFITTRVGYGSALRSMTELEVTREFAKYPQYFHCTTSCNANWKILSKHPPSPRGDGGRGASIWCCKCPKCAFVFALYAAFLPEKTLTEIFGRNLFNDDWLMPLYRELLGLQGFKPFECVGTPEETKEAFCLARNRGDLNDTPVMKMFMKEFP